MIRILIGCLTLLSCVETTAGENPKTDRGISGRAMFADGSPVVSSLLRFRLSTDRKLPPAKSPVHVDCMTADDGHFEAALPDDKKYAAFVMAYENGEAGDRKWRLNVPSLQPGSRVNLTFENRGKILVSIKYEEKLPGGYLPEVVCRSTAWGPKTAFAHKPQLGSGGVSLGRLEPGEYELTLAIKNVTETWTYAVTIPNQRPFKAKARIVVPRLSFGDIRARFLMPDGKSPASKFRFYLHNQGKGRSVTTDENGGLFVKQVLAGGFGLVPSQTLGVANVPVAGPRKVKANQVTDLGVIRLLHVDEAFGYFEGNVVYEDGQSVAPIHLAHLKLDSTFTGFTGPYKLSVSPPVLTKEPRAFRVQLEKGRQHLVFRLTQPPGGFPSSFNFGNATNGRIELIADVDIKAGKTLSRNIVLFRSKVRDEISLTHDFPLDIGAMMTAVVDSDGLRWHNTAYISAAEQRFQGVPAGDCHVVCLSPEFFLVQTIPEKRANQSAHFDTDQTGRIRVQVFDSKQEQLKGLGIRVSRQVSRTEFLACNVPPVRKSSRRAVLRTLKLIDERDDGTIEISNLSAGEYIVQVTNGEWTQEQTVDLDAKSVATIKLQVGADGKPLPARNVRE